jgi:hypothetical protein
MSEDYGRGRRYLQGFFHGRQYRILGCWLIEGEAAILCYGSESDGRV